ncbi:hypothetical protein [Chamaesiphon sp. OTE_8_metabat_110]|uniref:hypothetical protein n=1 Tax=Chamaesiphon sp. OTE_8_metabat_110 TaxID=2964696 RepID=UPI00286AFF57|nr:hypothetical protein [Chamaesiphon sp. OTE_8_metabat_110]
MFLPTLSQTITAIYTVSFTTLMTLTMLHFIQSAWKTLQKDWFHLKRLHQIPCDRCVFFTGEHNLKCTVNPYTAFQEEAIDCSDYRPIKSH